MDVTAASAQLLPLVQSIIPRPAWLIAVLFGLLLAPASAQRKSAPVGVVPPQPVQLNVKIRREGKTEIPLRIHGLANEPLQFLIRTPPIQGRLSEPRQTGRESAVAVYEPPADLSITVDRFFYAVKSAAGVSAPVEVLLTITDQSPQLTIPDTLDFPAVRTGDTSSKLLEISNTGGSLAVGEIIVEPPWRIEGKTGYRLATGDIAIFKIFFAPVAGGTFERVARFTSDPAHSTTLRGTAETSVAANPAEVLLQNSNDDPARTGTLELVNQTDEARTLQLKADDRLVLPPQVVLPGRGRVSVPLQLAAADVRPFNAEILITAPELELRVPVKAAATSAIIRAVPTAITFGRVALGRPTTARFELENIGGTPEEVTWTIAPPFRTAQGSTLLLPGEKRGFEIEIEPKSTGRYRAWLQCKAGAHSFDLAVDADAVATVRPATKGSTEFAISMAPGIPGDPVAPESPLESHPPPAAPRDWVGNSRLPPGVAVGGVTPTTATVIWPANLSTATRFRVDLRQFAYAPDGNLTVHWLELGGLDISRQGEYYVTTIRDLKPAQPWTIRVLPLIDGKTAEDRLFAIDFNTPPQPSFHLTISPLRGLLILLLAIAVWRVVQWARRPKHGFPR